MADSFADGQAELRTEINRLVLRRVRVTLCIALATQAGFMIVNHTWAASPPPWSDAFNLVLAALMGVALLLFKVPFIERGPVPFAVLVFASGCVSRTLVGVWRGDVVTTAIMLQGIALLGGATLPWGVLAQTTLAVIAAAGIALNSYLVEGGLGGPPGHAAMAIGLGLGVSVVIAAELQRHRLQLLTDNLRRRQAEARLAALNADLEQRVTQRTAELATTLKRLEQEVREHQEAVREMRESQRRLRGVLDHATVAVYLRDTEGRYQLVNHHWEMMAGQRAEQVVGKRIEEIMPSEVAVALQAHDRRVIESGSSLQFEETVPQADGPHTYVSVKFPDFDGNGDTIGVWGLSTDITERKRAEEQARRHQAELAHVLRLGTIGEMAAGLAHEINQPLGAVANYAQGGVLRLRDGSAQPVDLLPILEAIAQQALRAGEIIRRVRGLVRKEPAEQKPVDLNGLVRDVIHFVDADARQHDIQVQLDLTHGLPPVVCNDVQIEQVILNLVRNAVEAVQAAANGLGRITVATAPAGCDAVAVSVRDNGVGLPEPPADVFAPFYSTKMQGLGMGLSISRSIIEAHRGDLRARRNQEGGSTFHFTLPVAAADEVQHATVSGHHKM